MWGMVWSSLTKGLSTLSLLYHQEASGWINTLIAIQVGIYEDLVKNLQTFQHNQTFAEEWLYESNQTTLQVGLFVLIGLQHVVINWKIHKPFAGFRVPQKLLQHHEGVRRVGTFKSMLRISEDLLWKWCHSKLVQSQTQGQTLSIRCHCQVEGTKHQRSIQKRARVGHQNSRTCHRRCG